MYDLNDFSIWMKKNTKLSDSSISKYRGAVNTVSNEMIARRVICKSLLEMEALELDIAIFNILQNDYFRAKNTRGDSMYSNGLKQFRCFVHEIADLSIGVENIVEQVKTDECLNATEKQTVISARVGQGKYRRQLLEKYEGACVVTGINNPKMLVASHIKPWAVCNNMERVDVENGLILSPNIDKLFDYGLISFNNNGRMLISSFVGEDNVNRLYISSEIKANLRATHRLLSYLEYHRDAIFVK